MRPASEPNAAPRKTTGPCRPTEPPEPIVSVAATILPAALVAGSRPPRESSATITSGTEWPRAPGARMYVIGPTSRPPMAGMRISRAFGRPPSQSSLRMSKKKWSLSSTRVEKPTAARPAPSPTTAASTIGPARGERSMRLVRNSRSCLVAPCAAGVIRNTCSIVAPDSRKRLRHRGEAGRGRRTVRRRRFVATRGARSPRPSRVPRTPRRRRARCSRARRAAA